MGRRRGRRWRARIALLALCLAAPCQTGCARWFLLHPTTHEITAHGMERREVRAGSRAVEVWTRRFDVREGSEPELFVVELMGNAQRAEHGTLLPSKAQGVVPTESWLVNYPGFGGSDGPASLWAIPRALDAVHREVSREAKGRPVVVYGNSLGGTSALYVTARHEVSGAILQNPAPLGELILGRFGWWNLWLAAIPVVAQVPPSLHATLNARRSEAPALFLSSEWDQLVTPPYQQHLYCAYSGPKRRVVLKGRGHNGGLTEEAEEAVAAFLEDIAKGRPAVRTPSSPRR